MEAAHTQRDLIKPEKWDNITLAEERPSLGEPQTRAAVWAKDQVGRQQKKILQALVEISF